MRYEAQRGVWREVEATRGGTTARGRVRFLILMAAMLLVAPMPAAAQEGGDGGEGSGRRAPKTDDGDESPANESNNPSWMHGVTEGSWFYIGGAIGPNSFGTPTWGLTMGGTGYQPFFYAGGGFELMVLITDGPVPSPQGNFHIGTILPFAVFRPMIGFRVGGGTMLDSPHFDIGGQFGFAVGDRDTETSFRFLMEPVGQIHPTSRTSTVSTLLFTFALLN